MKGKIPNFPDPLCCPNLSQITENADIYLYYRNRLVNLFMSRFKWSLPDTCDQWFLERTLLSSGTATICRQADIWLSVGYTYQGRLDVYGYPTHIRGVGYGNYTNIIPDAFVVGFENMSRTSILNIIDIFARLLWEIHMTYRSNLQTQATPYIIAAPKNMQLSIKSILMKLFGKNPVIEVPSTFDPDIIKVVDLKVDFKGKDILDNLSTVWDMALSILGLMTGSEKKERMLSGEADANQWENLTALNSSFMARQIMIDKLKKIDPSFEWGVEIAKIPIEMLQLTPYDVKMSGEYDEIRGVQNNGNLHRNRL